ncbi:3-ketoacyl-CoA synthase 2 [Stylosanthes scabra]|uniref:very-long-chain 3-oxoacyl-CoA synthase n=1 Tax=Stylosanthes scabra TaxID=79078 RepID=A0ABU6W0F1_9FABA|nr:3-ketoacyl-CoA synthase 2 [Stylosanthes scabra]
MCTKEIFSNIITSPEGKLRDESLDFSLNILEKSGLGDKTYMSEPLLETPPNAWLAGARKEMESVVIGTIDELLLKTKVKTEEIGIIVTNCSIFNSIPSLSAMIVNHYKLRHNVVSYNLTGMGCSAGLISIDLAKQLLQVHPNSYALVFSTENISYATYCGNNRSMLVTNCLFRMGGAAILLSNHFSDSHRSKYYLKHIVRTHKGSQDDCYKSVHQFEDEEGLTGVALSKNVVSSAGKALNTNISTLGKFVLPWMEQVKFSASLVARNFLKINVIKFYTPKFVLAFEHFCIHTGGKAVLKEVQKILNLSDWHMEPSRMTLYRFGNTSSSSIWYELAYCEAKGRIKKGDRIWQIAFGSGFKCNSAVWCALQTIDPIKVKNSWTADIHEFPVNVTN